MKKVNSLQLMDEKAQLKKRAMEIIEAAKVEVRDLTTEEDVELQNLKDQIKEKDEELDALNKRLEKLSVEDEEEKEKEEIKEDKRNFKNSTMKKDFSLVRAIRSIANNQPLDDVNLAVIKAGEEEARKSGIATQGQIQIPLEERAAITVTGEGEDVTATHLMDILTPLRAKNVLMSAGAKVYSNLRGNVQFPVMSQASCNWESETGEASDGAPTFTHKTLSPKRLTTYCVLSKQLLNQDEISIENVVRQELINSINSKLEETLLGTAAGTTTKPAGIFYTISPTTVSDFEDVTDLEAAVEDANVTGECVYVLSNKAKSVLRNMKRSADSSRNVMEDGEVDGTKAFNTSNVDGKKYIYGDFSNLVIGFFGNLDVVVDNVTMAAQGCVKLVVNLYVDAQILRENAFVTGDLAGE